MRFRHLCWLMLLSSCFSVAPKQTGSSVTKQDAAAADAAAQCVQTQLCIQGDHWDSAQCKCVADAPTAGSKAPSIDAGSATCVQTQLCIRGDHWDATLCKCVPDASGSTSGAGGTVGCIQNQLCVRGDHWDKSSCKCVRDPAAGSGSSGTGVSGATGTSGTSGHASSGSGGAAGEAHCVQSQLCVRDSHWDAMLCRCVPDITPDAGTESCGATTCAAAEHCCQVASASDGTCEPRCQTVCPGQPCKVPSDDAGTPQSCQTASDCTGVLPHICAACAKPAAGATPNLVAPPPSGCAYWTCKKGQCQIALCE